MTITAPEQGARSYRLGLRIEALPAWRALVNELIQLDSLGIRTPCDQDPSAFTGDDLDRRQAAAKACGLCPVRQRCADFADANHEHLGVWGGRDRTWGAAAELVRRTSQNGEPERATP